MTRVAGYIQSSSWWNSGGCQLVLKPLLYEKQFDLINLSTACDQLFIALKVNPKLKMCFCCRYPLALGNLGDLQEISPTPGRPPAEEILKEGIKVNQILYKDQHIYPYTYLGGFYYRQKQYRKAIDCWVKAAYVAGK